MFVFSPGFSPQGAILSHHAVPLAYSLSQFPLPTTPTLCLTLWSLVCIAVNYIDTHLVICPILAKFKPGIVGQSINSCLKVSNLPLGSLGRRVRFCIQVFLCTFWVF